MLSFLPLFAGIIAGTVIDSVESSVAVEQLSRELDSVDRVSFYFLSRSGTYNYDRDKMVSKAYLVVHRSCGANCRFYLSPLLRHLSEAKRAHCSPGQQNMLVEFGSQTIVYGYSGRMIAIDGVCFGNSIPAPSPVSENFRN